MRLAATAYPPARKGLIYKSRNAVACIIGKAQSWGVWLVGYNTKLRHCSAPMAAQGGIHNHLCKPRLQGPWSIVSGNGRAVEHQQVLVIPPALMGCVERCIQRRRASLEYSNGCPRCYVPPSLHSQTLRAVGSRIGESTSGGLPVAGNNRSKRALLGCVRCCIQRRRASLQYSNG